MVEIITREFIQMAGNTGEVMAPFQCDGNSAELASNAYMDVC